MKSIKLFLLVFVLSAGYAGAQTQATLDDARKAIAASNELYFQAFARNEPSLFVDRYAEDCWIMPANAPVICGPDAVGPFFQTAYSKFGIRNGKFITVDVYGISADMVAEVGFWKVYDAGNTEFDDGKYIVLWKRTAKGWKMWRDSFNSSRSKKN
jgi:ketosteroid isomerase-like protein